MCDLYELIQSLTQKLQRKNKNLDYTKLIEDIGVILGTSGDISFDKWHEDLAAPYGVMYCTFTKKVLPLPEKVISGLGVEEFLDKNHFMIQIFRIPLTEEPTALNLLKIAVYTGLLVKTLRSSDFPEGIAKAYSDLKMHNMINYISRTEYVKLMEQMPDNMIKRINEGMVASAL